MRTVQEQCNQSIELSTYFSLFTPALDWILQNVGARSSDVALDRILEMCIEKKNRLLILCLLKKP